MSSEFKKFINVLTIGKNYKLKNIKDLILEKYPSSNKSSIMPQDYCYNKINEDSKARYIFEWIKRGEYKYLGEKSNYSGDIYWNGKKVGEWNNGERNLYKKYWIISSKPSEYDSINAFKNLPEVDWGNARNYHINVGDIVYIYISQPLQKIAIKTIVTKSEFDGSELLGNDEQFNIGNVRTREKYFRLKLIKFINNDLLSLDKLQENGINGNIQGKQMLKEQTLSYIEQNEGSSSIVDDFILNYDLEKGIKNSKKITSNERKKRLEKANKKPEEVQVISRGFKRNADVIVVVLNRANGFCERCKCKSPFIRKKDNTPYLEVHHKIQLADGGDDSVENAIAVCPNCHREMHFGI